MSAIAAAVATFRDLARRAQEATGPDRVLDADVAQALGWCEDDGWWLCPGSGWVAHPPTWSASLDAVIRDVVPAGWGWIVCFEAGSGPLANVNPPRGGGGSLSLDGCATPELALLAAALLGRAVLAEAEA